MSFVTRPIYNTTPPSSATATNVLTSATTGKERMAPTTTEDRWIRTLPTVEQGWNNHHHLLESIKVDLSSSTIDTMESLEEENNNDTNNQSHNIHMSSSSSSQTPNDLQIYQRNQMVSHQNYNDTTGTGTATTNHLRQFLYKNDSSLLCDSENIINHPRCINDESVSSSLFFYDTDGNDDIFRRNTNEPTSSESQQPPTRRSMHAFDAMRRNRSQRFATSSSHHDCDDDEEEEEEDENRLNGLLDHDKDYIDLQPPTQIRPCLDRGVTSHNNGTPSFVVVGDIVSDNPPVPPKLRSFSEPEVRDSILWYNTTTTTLNNESTESTFSMTPNVLRNRHHSTNINNSLNSSGISGVVPTRLGLRGRSYTADPTTTFTASTNTQFRQRISTNRSMDDTTTDDHYGMRSGDMPCSTTATIWNNNINNDYRLSKLPPLQSFHSSWDDDSIDHRSKIALAAPSFYELERIRDRGSTTTTTNLFMPKSSSSLSTSSSLLIGTSTAATTNARNNPLFIGDREGLEVPLTSIPSTSASQQPYHQDHRTSEYASSRSIIITNNHNNNNHTNTITHNNEPDQERVARLRWIRINRRFQLLVAVVVLIFSLLLFAILVCWIVFASTIILAWDKPCDLKLYFGLASLQLLLDIFRTDILRHVFRWNQQSNESIPGRVIAYNIVYFIYAILVLQLGIRNVVTPNECHTTAPELFHAGVAFISLSVAAWITILFGYAVPFCVVAILLTVNGYNPHTYSMNSSSASTTSPFPFISCGYATSGAPPGCVDKLSTIELRNLTDSSFPKECCICMESFNDQDVIVTTKCQHIFHKSCCREWLRQARTCPVCRDDIPSSFEPIAATLDDRQDNENAQRQTSSTPHHTEHQFPHIPTATQRRPSRGPVPTLLRALFEARNRFTENHATATVAPINQNYTRPATMSPAGIITDIERG